jgi:hypothetical protein
MTLAAEVVHVGNLILLRLSTEGVIAPAANLPLVSLTPVANYCRCLLTPLANFLPASPQMPATALMIWYMCQRHWQCIFNNEYLREFSKHFKRT